MGIPRPWPVQGMCKGTEESNKDIFCPLDCLALLDYCCNILLGLLDEDLNVSIEGSVAKKSRKKEKLNPSGCLMKH